MDLNFIEMLILIIVLFMSASNLKLEGQVKRLKISLDQIAKQVGVSEDPVNKEVKALVDSGEDIKAVKKARGVYGFTLLEGKQYVDGLKSEEE